MAKGFILHRLDPTSCGGRVLEGSSNRRTNGNPVARMGIRSAVAKTVILIVLSVVSHG